MLTAWLLRIHRWVALLFALPLIVVLATGLILSFEPALVVAAIEPGSLDVAKVESLLARHDSAGRARALALRSYEHTLTIGGGRQGGPTIDLATGQQTAGPGTLATLFGTSRRMHETLLLEAGWLVTASTFAMLGLLLLGLLMGLPRLRNSVAGWHKATGWFLLPLLVLSPLTGLALAFHITLSGAPPAPAAREGPPMKLIEAVRVLARDHDLASLVWLRGRGDRLLARLVEGGEYRVYAVTPAGAVPMPRNWPRLLHEGNWGGLLSALLNVVTSIGLIGLLATGLYLWVRRKVVRLARRRVPAAQA